MAGEQQGDLVRRLRAVVEARTRRSACCARAGAERELRRRLELRLAEVERRLSMDSPDSGTPPSKERIGAKEARRARQQSERERSKDRRRGGQPGHKGKGLARDPDPGEKKDAEPPAQCRRCNAGLDGAEAAAPRWAQVIDVQIARKVTEWLLPGLSCPCCGTVTFAEPPPGLHAGAVSYGPVLNAAAVLLACYGNVPSERAAQVAGMLLGVPVSAGWVDKAAARTSAQLGKAGFDEAMIAALAAGKVLAADETPVNVLDKTVQPAARDEEDTDPEEKDGKAAAGAPHVLIVRTPRRAADLPAGHRLAAQGRCRRRDPGRVHRAADHRRVHRVPAPARPAGRHRAVLPARHPPRPRRDQARPRRAAVLGGDILTTLREAHRAVENARARGSTALDPQVLQDLRERYD